MALPWLQIVQLVPSIVDVSRELLKKNKAAPPPPDPNMPIAAQELVARVAALEENERRQAELVSQIADQLAVVTKLAVDLRQRVLWLAAASGVAVVVAIAAIVVAVRY